MKELILLKVIEVKKCMIWHYWFFNHRFKVQDSVCNGCHDLIILSVNISNITIITVKNIDCCCIIHNSKSEGINLSKNSALEDIENIVLIFSLFGTIFFYFFCFIIYKMVDSECSMGIYKSVKISIGAVMRNPDMLRFVSDHLKD